jgi:hypothetical protein
LLKITLPEMGEDGIQNQWSDFKSLAVNSNPQENMVDMSCKEHMEDADNWKCLVPSVTKGRVAAFIEAGYLCCWVLSTPVVDPTLLLPEAAYAGMVIVALGPCCYLEIIFHFSK